MNIARHYSGPLSEQFWELVGQLEGEEHDRVYSLGVALQNLESRVLCLLEGKPVDEVSPNCGDGIDADA